MLTLWKPAALLLVLPLLMACGTTPTATELCQNAFDKKCTDDDDGYTVAKCAEGAQSILDAASQQGASCRESVDRYFACVEDTLDGIDQCTDGDELDVCSNDGLACAIQRSDDDVRSN